MSLLLSAWLVHAAPLNQWMPGDIVIASARGAIRGAVLGPVPDGRVPSAPVKWDANCFANPLAKGCM
ncbi:MAG: hypothetical protein JNL83_31860 [Myxococcales bacterium]|nr:hypothetical protein [Myxococcales bacterium]